MLPLPGIETCASGSQRSYGLDDFRTDRNAGIDHLFIARFKGVLDALADPRKCVGQAAGCHIPGQIEVHQAVNGFGLYFRVVVVGGANQRIQTVLSADIHNGLHCLLADFQVRVAEIVRRSMQSLRSLASPGPG